MSRRVATPRRRTGGLDLGFAHRHHSGGIVQPSFRALHDGFKGLIALSHFWRVDILTGVGTLTPCSTVPTCNKPRRTVDQPQLGASCGVTESRVVETVSCAQGSIRRGSECACARHAYRRQEGERRIECRDSYRYFVEPYEGPSQRSSAVPFASVADATYSSHAFDVVGSRVAASTATGQTRATSGISRNANLPTRTQSSWS
jgi:hypothetical protein